MCPEKKQKGIDRDKNKVRIQHLGYLLKLSWGRRAAALLQTTPSPLGALSSRLTRHASKREKRMRRQINRQLRNTNAYLQAALLAPHPTPSPSPHSLRLDPQ